MPLHIKPSDQAKIQGNPIFDPVGSNEYIKNSLVKLGWHSNILVPTAYRFLGKDVDFGKSGIILESQFSNYPFLLNNVLRSELFFKGSINFAGCATKLLVIITKAQMFPASNSTLYYEQAVQQLTALINNRVFDIPIRLIGLFEQKNITISAIYTEYQSTRYSRVVRNRMSCTCQIVPSKAKSKRYRIQII
ncbi:restriction endonuclease [Aliinostoc sp. HNIBRCY26]|uniref:restriction endonuclease n=1 Tax=Aliinostoc sp. HNIBRCY26 TaxID=3418997 RepID=UPI003CFCD70A